ncbi:MULTISPECIES: cupin domain-containing protein [Vibrio]|uniref:cupin domain-containing protein n=1 Tax=Vibrio TaxID=662 RepID=UPI002076044E|nr:MULTISPECIES: cupin domain-containing protein [Vibrio]USD33758.1 cupin domain-containing protein [Vibrio sp. SCSIO 43186]USD46858.1 cupin domain-containing protein [Vibrio sp. SCSIO 43145]USD70883.1 cupin domain-containing protein [Vibrio sp. SCSIO 43139]USD95794.1 cupin [Vibrio coralliilyticus]
MAKSTVITIEEEFSKLNYLSGRTPKTTDEESKDAFAMLSEYSNGGVYIGHYDGYSEWERHSHGDELVQVLSGQTTLVLLVDGKEQRNELSQGQLLVVPQAIWHRFETPNGVQVMTITPQPTDHQIELPNGI